MEEPMINPTVLARELGILKLKAGEGDGRLLSWERFWDLVEQRYWSNRAAITPYPVEEKVKSNA